jgi:hypothetical protein
MVKRSNKMLDIWTRDGVAVMPQHVQKCAGAEVGMFAHSVACGGGGWTPP